MSLMGTLGYFGNAAQCQDAGGVVTYFRGYPFLGGIRFLLMIAFGDLICDDAWKEPNHLDSICTCL